MNIDRPFRTDTALAHGSLTREQVRSAYFPRIFPRIAVAHTTPLTLAVRAEAAGLVHPRAVVAGVAAAALWRAECAPADVTVDLVVDVAGVRETPGLRRRRMRLPSDEVTTVLGTRVTTPARTGYDLARWLPLAEAVVALDALLRTTGVTVGAIRGVAAAHPGDRDRSAVEPALAWTDPRSATPSASRVRVALLGRGLPVPLVGRQLLDARGRLVARLPLAWPDTRTGVATAPAGGPAGGVAAAARAVGWEVVAADPPAALDRPDDLAVRLVRLLARWDPPSLAGVAGFPLPPPPEGDGTCDGGLSRLVEA